VLLDNQEWDVWDVRPQARLGTVGKGMENGWLCFQSGTRRRRLTPIPDNWDELDERRLHELFMRAKEVRQVLNESGQVMRAEARLHDQRAMSDRRDERGERFG
jgi:hypothetical protein